MAKDWATRNLCSDASYRHGLPGSERTHIGKVGGRRPPDARYGA